MANKKIKHIVAKLLGESTEETLDIYDESALHATDIVDNLTSTDATKVLSAKQGKALNDSLAKWILGGSATAFRAANNEQNTDIGLRVTHSDNSSSNLTMTENAIRLYSLSASGATTEVLSVCFCHTEMTANGTSETTATLSPALANWQARRIIGVSNGGSNNGKNIVSIIPKSPTSATVNWSGNVASSGTLHVTFIYW